jgi:hypothetical protein
MTIFGAVIYNPCTEGECSAWIVRRSNPDVYLYPCDYETIPSDDISVFSGMNVIYVNTCPMPPYLVTLASVAQTVHIIDSHRTNYECIRDMDNMPGNVTCDFSNDHSSCHLTWKYFNMTQQPWFVKCISDQATLSLPFTREYLAGMTVKNLLNLDGFQRMYDNSRNTSYIDDVLDAGSKELEYINRSSMDAIRRSKMECQYKQDEDHVYHVWLFTCDKSLVSDVGHILMSEPFSDGSLPDFVVGWNYDVLTNCFNLSMRSTDQKQDVGLICTAAGGRGKHHNSAECRVYDPLREIFTPCVGKG